MLRLRQQNPTATAAKASRSHAQAIQVGLHVTHRRSEGVTSRVLATRSRWGYTVGSRAPDAAVSSGTTQSEEAEWKKTFLGGLFAKKPAPPPKTKGSRMKRPGTI